MSFHQPDPQNAPELSFQQRYDIFLKNGGRREDFALQTASSSTKIFAIEAHVNGSAIAFLGSMLRLDKDPQAAKLVQQKITITQDILSGKKPSIPEIGMNENLGLNYVGNY